jgi:hypothetical protein
VLIGIARERPPRISGVHPDHFAPGVHERSARVTGSQVDIGVYVARPAKRSPHGPETAHYSGGHRSTPSPRISDGEG